MNIWMLTIMMKKNRYHEITGYEPIKQADMAIDFIKRNKGDAWGLYVSLGPPHDPYDRVPSKYLDLYNDCEINLRANVKDNAIYSKEISIDQKRIIEKIQTILRSNNGN